MNLSLLAALAGVVGACAGAYISGAGARARWLVPFSGAVLLAVSLFSILPEIASEAGWSRTLLLYACGYAGLYLIDRYVHPVCPSCSHGHGDGYVLPLVVATGLHAFVDGWGMTIAQQSGQGAMRTAIPLAILLHKIPEGLALGVMLRTAVAKRSNAMLLGSATEACTAIGAVVAVVVLPGVSADWARDLLAIAGGTFLYLGSHALYGLFRRFAGKS